ncbi:MAG: hypothetical protein EP298_08545 [Gammaproteobacteria bacterium]|nr:MAG: hypothetical protein EP298_08545 [Gammaproteobacteria bacterium]UTW42828.1 hypothetical protein KFE69_01415 [bacterium SCSIO 12844]
MLTSENIKQITISIISTLGLITASSTFANILNGDEFKTLLKSPSDCTSDTCPSGAYLVNDHNGNTLFKLGSQIGGPQDTTHEGETTQWSSKRYAILIDQGNYTMSGPFKLGYYTEITGVAPNRDQVIVSPGINVLNNCLDTADPNCKSPGGLNNFWRSLSNLTINTASLGHPLRFAVSQASPIRNIAITGGQNLLMCDWGEGGDCGYTSGGFMDNVKVDQNLILGSQQQYYITDSTFNQLQAGVWNIVSNNNNGTNTGSGDSSTKNPWPGYPFTMTNSTQLHNIQAPHIINDNGTWKVSVGNQAIPINQFIILTPDNDKPTEISKTEINQINTQLSNNAIKGLIIMPGIYKLQGTINTPNDKTILGLGIPALVCQSQTGSCMTTASEGVHISGITFDAGTNGNINDPQNTLLTIGTKGQGKINNPTILQDVYCRIARTEVSQDSPSAYSCITVNANYTIGQNLWLWRADHDVKITASLVPWTIDQAQYGLIVNGNHVTMNALAVEHFENYQTVWNGTDGEINFYQSEMPYFMPLDDGNDQKTISCALPGEASTKQQVCASLYITANASNFKADGLGIYSYFPSIQAQKTINAETAIKVDITNNILINHVVTRWLNGDSKSGIDSIMVLKDGSSIPQGSKVDGTTKGYALDNYSA